MSDRPRDDGDAAADGPNSAPGVGAGLRERTDPLGLVVGSVVGLAGLLFLAQPIVGDVRVGAAAIPAFVLSAGVLGLGFGIGAVGFGQRGRTRLAAGHAAGAVAWLALFLGASVGSQLFVVAGVVVVIAGAFFLVERVRERA